MTASDTFTYVLIAAIIGVGGAVLIGRKVGNAETTLERRWSDAGGVASPVDRPIVFAFVLARKLNRPVRTKYLLCDEI